MSVPKFICIFGQMNNGKSTIARMLRQSLENNIQKVNRVAVINAFSNPIKEQVAEVMGVSREWLEQWKNKNELPPGWGKTVRQVLQEVGEYWRTVNPDVWINQAFTWFNHGKSLAPIIRIYEDGRYRNEFRASVDRQGFNIFVYRPEHYVSKPYHYSEVWCETLAYSLLKRYSNYELDQFNAVIRNDQSEEHLRDRVDEIMNLLFNYYL